jgi:putative flippase GtrA
VGVRELARKHEEKLRFLIVGVWNVVFSLGVLYLMERYIPHDPGSPLQRQLILTGNWVIAVTQNFFSFKLLVFRTKGRWLTEYARMYVTYFLTFIVQSLLIQTISATFHVSMVVANIPTIFVVTILSYLGHKYFTFRGGRHVVEDLDAGEAFEHPEDDGLSK